MPAHTVLLGSHLDTVRDAGRYDGMLGVLVALACIERLRDAPFAVEVLGFADEEGVRYGTAYLGSSVVAGAFDPDALARRDADGVPMADAIAAFGGDPAALDGAQRDRDDLLGYVEVHIEQGPVLLDAGRPLGVVTSIASGTRYMVRVHGVAGHAGTVPMPVRRDALAAAAEMVLAVEARARTLGAVGTVGMLQVPDGTGNVIPGEVHFTIDMRAGDDATRSALETAVRADLDSIAARRGVRVDAERRHDVKAAPCAPWLQDQIEAAVKAVGADPMRLPSGAGHDAMVFEEVTDVGMLFVRCGAGGISHNPAETITSEDAALARRALLEFLRRFVTPA
jgi:hydantoinase/carbamoylase family amidase